MMSLFRSHGLFLPFIKRFPDIKICRVKRRSQGCMTICTVIRHRWMKSSCWSISAVREFSSNASEKVNSIALTCFFGENSKHIDHGKSTLADRLLEITGDSLFLFPVNYLDKLQVERERGITVKAQTASCIYQHDGQTYLLNLIGTPGHVDFSYEVSRSISACQRVLLIVDANQGIQAQTVASFYLAFEAQLTIIPVINKVDITEIIYHLSFKCSKHFIYISAKLGTNVDQVLQEVVKRIPPPTARVEDPFKALVFDSTFDHYRGVVANIALFGGHVSRGDKIVSAHLGKSYEVNELGLLRPDEHPTETLYAGQVGYVIAGMKEVKEAQIGDTLYLQKQSVELLPGFKPAKAMVFAGMYPMDQSEYTALRSAVEKLTLNDSSVTVQRDSSLALGAGWRLGFLGLLHMEVFNQLTAPTVPYKAVLASVKLIKVVEYLEPMVMGTIIAPDDFTGKIMTLCQSRRAVQKNMFYIDDHRVMMKYIFPLNEIVVDFYDQLKSMSSGYTSFDYEGAGYEAADLIKMDFLLNGRPVEELAIIVHKDSAYSAGKAICERLKESIPRQMFEIAVQAAIGTYRKNLLILGDIYAFINVLKRK
uniref:GUF1 homolog, GTPase n=1 Tax=Sinocyclocheilus anshuiensis TaxID=1608454 RepID=A0A671K3V3_9TELE